MNCNRNFVAKSDVTREVLTWHRHTTSTSVASISTTLPFPSSPHWAPTDKKSANFIYIFIQSIELNKSSSKKMRKLQFFSSLQKFLISCFLSFFFFLGNKQMYNLFAHLKLPSLLNCINLSVSRVNHHRFLVPVLTTWFPLN